MTQIGSATDTASPEGLYPAGECRVAPHRGSAMQRLNVTRVYEMLSKIRGPGYVVVYRVKARG